MHFVRRTLSFVLTCTLMLTLQMSLFTGQAKAAGSTCRSSSCNGISVQLNSMGKPCVTSCDKNCTSVQIGNHVSCIRSNAFKDCTNLKNVTVPGCVKSVGSCAFNGCSNLSTVTLEKNTSRIGNNAFKNCNRLKTIKIRSTKLNTKCVSDHAFQGVGKNVTIQVPKDKVTCYKSLFRKKGLCKNAKVCALK